jgi:phosphate transport system substrate-binding protein
MKWGRRALTILALTLAGCQSPLLSVTPAPETIVLHLWSTEATAPLVQDLAAGYQAAHPELRIALRLSTTSYTDLIASAGQPEGEAPHYGITHHWPQESPLWAAPIAQDQIAVIVHLDNPVTGLRLEELQAIYQGRIVNWAALGGEDRAITVVSREEDSDTRLAFQRAALGDRSVTLNARLAASTAAVLQVVREDRGAIGYISLGLLEPGVRPLAIDGVPPQIDTLNGYPLQAPIFVVGVEEPQGVYREFFAWMQNAEGQAVIARKYHPLLE